MTLEQVKRNIIEVLKGERVKETNLFDFIANPIGIEKTWSPSKLLFNFTELELPEKYYDSVYYVTLDGKEEETRYAFVKEVLVFLGTEDGETADYIGVVYPPRASIETMNYIRNALRQEV